MIKANELRIGNWVEANSPMMQVAVIGKYNIELYMPGSEADTFNFDPNEVNPIPLSPDILLSAGFENRSNSTDFAFKHGEFIIGGTMSRMFPSVHGESGLESYGNEIFYIHQLQNLYFALTGEELTINL